MQINSANNEADGVKILFCMNWSLVMRSTQIKLGCELAVTKIEGNFGSHYTRKMCPRKSFEKKKCMFKKQVLQQQKVLKLSKFDTTYQLLKSSELHYQNTGSAGVIFCCCFLLSG